MSGYDFASELAILELQGNPFSTPNNAYIDEIVFRDVNVISTYLGSSYFFFQEEASNIKKVKFENVHSYGHRGFFRLDGEGISVDSLILVNCVIDSCREYGLTHIAGADANINHIHTRNSTFWRIVRPHYNRSVTVDASNTILHENVTFYNAPDVGRYFLDYETGTEVTFKNCIFGKTTALEVVGDTTQGYKPGTVNITSIGSYFTNDFINASEPLPDLIPYPRSSYDLFEDPDNKNFKIKDSGFSGANTAGDPRWW